MASFETMPLSWTPTFAKRLVEEQTAAHKMAHPLKECQGRIPKTGFGLGFMQDLSHQSEMREQKQPWQITLRAAVNNNNSKQSCLTKMSTGLNKQFCHTSLSEKILIFKITYKIQQRSPSTTTCVEQLLQSCAEQWLVCLYSIPH